MDAMQRNHTGARARVRSGATNAPKHTGIFGVDMATMKTDDVDDSSLAGAKP